MGVSLLINSVLAKQEKKNNLPGDEDALWKSNHFRVSLMYLQEITRTSGISLTYIYHF